MYVYTHPNIKLCDGYLNASINEALEICLEVGWDLPDYEVGLEPNTVDEVLLLEIFDDCEESVGFVVDAFSVKVVLR